MSKSPDSIPINKAQRKHIYPCNQCKLLKSCKGNLTKISHCGEIWKDQSERYEHEEDNFLNNIRSQLCGGINVYYTGRKAKRDFMAKLNIFPDIWIDDNPHWIYQDSQ